MKERRERERERERENFSLMSASPSPPPRPVSTTTGTAMQGHTTSSSSSLSLAAFTSFPASDRGKKVFANGDVYTGSSEDGLISGVGTYAWRDGSTYTGEWKRGKKHGHGTYSWVSGSTYTGEWCRGLMQGFGTFRGADGSMYTGNWRRDANHGLGRRRFANGDVYDGLWKDGVAEGPGTYKWVNGNEYDGEWSRGYMDGRGTFVWSSGERYDGEWKASRPHGKGIYKWPDGSVYEGSWADGLKHGVGIWFSPLPGGSGRGGEAETLLRSDGSRRRSMIGGSRSESAADGSARSRGGGGGAGAGTGAGGGGGGGARAHMNQSVIGATGETSATTAMPQSPEAVSSSGGSVTSTAAHMGKSARATDTSDAAPSSPIAGSGGADMDTATSSTTPPQPEQQQQLAIVRMYDRSVLVSERRLQTADLPFSAYIRSQAPAKVKARTLKKAGETIYRGHRSYDLMLDLQLGIRISLTRANAEPSRRLLDADLMQKTKEVFPREGSATTPPHPAGDFTWKDYSPLAFRDLREAAGMGAGEYMLSICGDKALRELSSPGKSGSVFFISHDDKFLIKTMRKAEMKLLREFLPKYYRHMAVYKDTLLPRFFGLHVVKPRSGRKVRFVVMKNLFGDLPINMRFDLKGSTYGRATPSAKRKESSTLKDLDLEYAFSLEPELRKKIIRQMKVDCALLESLRVMDYSVLLGIHFCEPDESYTKSFSSNASSVSNFDDAAATATASAAKAKIEESIGGDGLTLALAIRDKSDDFAPGTDAAAAADGVGGDGGSGDDDVMATVAPVVAETTQSPVAGGAVESGAERMMSYGVHRPPQPEFGYSMHAIAVQKRVDDMNALARQASTLAAQRKFRQALSQTSRADSSSSSLSMLDMGEKAHALSSVEEPKKVILYFGIIDILQEYNAAKQIETFYKGVVGRRTEISSVDPKFYASRFLAFMSGVFEKAPDALPAQGAGVVQDAPVADKKKKTKKKKKDGGE